MVCGPDTSSAISRQLGEESFCLPSVVVQLGIADGKNTDLESECPGSEAQLYSWKINVLVLFLLHL